MSLSNYCQRSTVCDQGVVCSDLNSPGKDLISTDIQLVIYSRTTVTILSTKHSSGCPLLIIDRTHIWVSTADGRQNIDMGVICWWSTEHIWVLSADGRQNTYIWLTSADGQQNTYIWVASVVKVCGWSWICLINCGRSAVYSRNRISYYCYYYHRHRRLCLCCHHRCHCRRCRSSSSSSSSSSLYWIYIAPSLC